MIRKFLIIPLILVLVSCNSSEEKESTAVVVNDSISKAGQRRYSDSVKKTNPLLILPPDSTYTGDYIDKYPNGIVKFRGQYRFGERHGQWLSFYPDGTTWSEMQYDKGLRHGPNVTFYLDGKTRYSGHFKNDKQDSLWVYYDSIGNPVHKIMYKDNRIIKKLPLN